MRFVAPKERDSNVITQRLKTGNNTNKGGFIQGLSFKRNVKRIGKIHKNYNNDGVKDFLL